VSSVRPQKSGFVTLIITVHTTQKINNVTTNHVVFIMRINIVMHTYRNSYYFNEYYREDDYIFYPYNDSVITILPFRFLILFSERTRIIFAGESERNIWKCSFVDYIA